MVFLIPENPEFSSKVMGSIVLHYLRCASSHRKASGLAGQVQTAPGLRIDFVLSRADK